MKLIIDTAIDSHTDALRAVNALFEKERSDDKQSEQNEEKIVIQLRDGDKTTKELSERLNQLSFKYYKKFKGKNDPHWTLKCIPSYWEKIKDDPVFDGLKVWTSNGGVRNGNGSSGS